MRLLRHIIICIALGIGVLCHAQSPRNMDEDIRMAIPHYNCAVDEYTQYAPGAVMLGLKVCGYEGRTGWGQMLTADEKFMKQAIKQAKKAYAIIATGEKALYANIMLQKGVVVE